MKLIFSILLTPLFVFTSYGQTKNGGETTKQIKKYLSDIENAGFNGAVLIDLNGSIIILDGFGFSDREKQIKNTPTTIFDIGSISKQFTSAAILKLEMQGKLSTEDKISVYFPNVPEAKKNITIHQLLRHRSGLTDNVGEDYEKITKGEFIDKVFTAPLHYEVDSEYFYSNVGYSLLAMIIEKVSGKTYEEYLYKNLWKPVQMEMTGYARPNFDEKKIAVGYTENDSIWGKPNDKPWDKTAPYWHLTGNGGILSTTEDLLKWHKGLASNTILSKEATQKLYLPILEKDETEEYYYGYGWVVENTNRNTTKISHNGSNGIFFSDFYRFIDEDVTILHLTNKLHPNFSNLNQELAKMIFNADYKPNIPTEDNEKNRDFTDQIVETISNQGLEQAKFEYVNRKPNEDILEFRMRRKGSEYLKNKEADIAIKIHEMNLYAYPHSSRALQGLGLAYNNIGNKDLALKYLKESLRINPENRALSDFIKKLEE